MIEKRRLFINLYLGIVAHGVSNAHHAAAHTLQPVLCNVPDTELCSLNTDSDPRIRFCGFGSGMNIPDYISWSLETFFWVKNTDAESLWPWIRDGKFRIRDDNPGSAILLGSVSHSDVAGFRLWSRFLDAQLHRERELSLIFWISFKQSYIRFLLCE